MKKIILQADDELLRRAELVARLQGMTLDEAFREWLVQLAAQSSEVKSIMRQLRHVKAGRHFSRDEMNER